MKQIECKNVFVNYDSTVAVKDVSFSINEGDYLCILGENGSGKSTLIKAILGLEKVKSGEILFLNGLSKNEIGYLPQQTIVQKDFPASVFEVVISGTLNSRGIKPFYSKKEKNIANENIEKLGLTDIKNRSYKELSGGQQQRVLLARALCSTKKIIVLDEPITGLDINITKEMYSIIRKINEEGITIIMVSHDINFAVKNANKILHLKNECKFFGTVAEYMESDVYKKFIGGSEND
jgi:zinc transport system ATP-binding protein